jgi:hypothetical protein
MDQDYLFGGSLYCRLLLTGDSNERADETWQNKARRVGFVALGWEGAK